MEPYYKPITETVYADYTLKELVAEMNDSMYEATTAAAYAVKVQHYLTEKLKLLEPLEGVTGEGKEVFN